MSVSVQIRNDQKKIRINQSAVKRLLERCLKRMRLPHAEISVLLTDDKTIRRLNHIHRGINRPTDVLSFGMREQRRAGEPLPPHPEILGDLVVSVPAIQRQAKARGISLQTELHFIMIHGLLHLLGYDHTNKMQKLRMDSLHASLLAACQEK